MADLDQNRRIMQLERQIAEMRETHARMHHEQEHEMRWLHGVRFSGYLQPQLVLQTFNAAASPNLAAGGLPPGVSSNDVIARPDGTTTNPDFFRLRRVRFKAEFEPSKHAAFVFEIDPTSAGGPSGGIGTVARNVEADGVVHWGGGVVTRFGMGIFKIPYGWEVLQSDADRPFIERSWWEQNVTPGEFDTGMKAYTTAFEKRMAVQVAVVNGQTQGEKNFAVLPDLNKGKDVVGRFYWDFGPFDAGVSGDYGQGQVVDAAALVFKNYRRWALNVEAALHHRFTSIGETRVFGEFNLGSNMDRGVVYAFALPGLPADVVHGSVTDRSELGWFVRGEQDITRWFTLAVRFDSYSPDTSVSNDARNTLGGVGVVHFTRHLQSMTEFDYAWDNVHDPSKEAPGKQIGTASEVLQVRFP